MCIFLISVEIQLKLMQNLIADKIIADLVKHNGTFLAIYHSVQNRVHHSLKVSPGCVCIFDIRNSPKLTVYAL